MAEVTNNKVDYLSTLNAGSGLNTTQIIDALVDAEIVTQENHRYGFQNPESTCTLPAQNSLCAATKEII
mgnify:CR=1 FL=1